MKVKEIMKKPVLISETTTKKELHKIAKKNPEMPIFIVVDKDKKFLGDIHENDLFYMILPNDRYEDIGIELEFDLEKKFFAETAKEIMRRHDTSCSPEDEIMDAALVLAGVEINEMPVINKKGKVVGVITEGILLRHIE
jgi:CBS domain-containing protein